MQGIVVSNVLVNKLETMSMDIKIYMNACYSTDVHEKSVILTDEEYEEVREIRNRIKTLNKKLTSKLK